MRIGKYNIQVTRKEAVENIPTVIDLAKYSGELFGRFSPFATKNFYTTFKEIGEVQFPVNFICTRAKNANFVLKKWSDDSVVWDNERINKFLEKPNPLYSFKDLLSFYIQMKLVLGNAFLFANVNPAMYRNIWKYCDSYYILPTQHTEIKQKQANIFSIDNVSDLVYYYQLNYGVGVGVAKYDPKIVLHSRDSFDFANINDNLMGFSRLGSQKYTLANLIAVYEARNVIYTKRGALGAIISKASDDSGTVALTKTEMEELQEEFQKEYGLNNKKKLLQLSRFPIDFVSFGATIENLKPFEETLEDAVQIAGIFGVNKELIPRRDNSTFNNQEAAEISAYNNTIIPMVSVFLSEINDFLGLNDSGFYIDASWENVSVLQKGKKEEQERKKVVSERCSIDFRNSIITLNDWRAELDMEAIEKPLYRKTLIEMSEAERNELRNIIAL